MLQSLFRFEEDKQMQRVEAQEARVSANTSLSDAALLNQLRELETPITRIADQMNIYQKVQEETRYREILDWLSPVPYNLHHQQPLRNRLPGTGEWLLNHHDYLQWRSSSVSCMFLLHGPAGSGKTSLVSTIVESFILDAKKQPSSAPIAHFYCAKSASEPARSEPSEILGSILRQISTNPAGKTVHSVITNEYERRQVVAKFDDSMKRLNTLEITDLILEIVATVPATIVIDAVDELQRTDRYELVAALKTICRKSEDLVKILLTSRDDDQILALLSDSAKVQINAHANRDDMETFVCHSVAHVIQSCSLLSGKVSPALQADLVRAILHSARER